MNIHHDSLAERSTHDAFAIAPMGGAFATAPAGGAFDLRALAGTVWKGRAIVAIAIGVALVVAIVAIAGMRPAFRATSTVLFETAKPGFASLEDTRGGRDFTRDTLENEVQILSSTNLIGRVVDTLELGRHPEFAPGGARSVFGRLAGLLGWGPSASPPASQEEAVSSASQGDAVSSASQGDAVSSASQDDAVSSASQDDAVSSASQDDAVSSASQGDAVPSASQGDAVSPAGDDAARRRRFAMVAKVQAGLTLRPVPGSRVIAIAFRGRDPVLAARIVNTLAEAYIVGQLEAKLTASRRASDWLAAQVGELRERVGTAELAVEKARAGIAAESGQTSEMTRQQLAALTLALAETRAEKTRIAAQYQGVAAAFGQGDADLGAVTLLRDAPVIARLRQEESALLARDATFATFARESPERARLRSELAGIRETIRSEAGRVVAALAADLAVARAREASLARDVTALEATGQAQRRGEIALRQTEREAEASRVLYESLLGRLQESAAGESLQNADARILSPAEVPLVPEGSAENRVLMLSLALGLIAGVGTVVVLDRIRNTFRAVEELEAATGLPVLACLPAVGAEIDRFEVVAELHERPNGLLAEAVRNLRTSVLFTPNGPAPRVVVFTSSIPREGKSTTSLLMALTCQQMGRSAIIVDCDLRLHALSTLMGQSGARPGLMSVLAGTATIAEAVHTDPDTGLTILTAQPAERGRTVSAADVVASAKFEALIEALTASYDLVVIDTPPALVVSDARIIARLADCVVYAVRWDMTPRGAVHEGLRELRNVDAPLAGLVLTMVDAGRVPTYAYEGYGPYRRAFREELA